VIKIICVVQGSVLRKAGGGPGILNLAEAYNKFAFGLDAHLIPYNSKWDSSGSLHEDELGTDGALTYPGTPSKDFWCRSTKDVSSLGVNNEISI
jgi:hypothetical protein